MAGLVPAISIHMARLCHHDRDARDKPAHDATTSVMVGIIPRMTVESEMPSTRIAAAVVPNDLESFWIPFTPNRAFKRAPRLFARAKDMHYYTDVYKRQVLGASFRGRANGPARSRAAR